MGIAAQTGLGGNNQPVLLDNKGKLTKIQKKMCKEAMDLYKPLEYGVDYQLFSDEIAFGREPGYQYEDLLIIGINRDKDLSWIETGRAVEAWASKIISRKKYYGQFKYKGKFVRFIDKWHKEIYD